MEAGSCFDGAIHIKLVPPEHVLGDQNLACHSHCILVLAGELSQRLIVFFCILNLHA